MRCEPALVFPAVPGLNHSDKHLLTGAVAQTGGIEVLDVALPVLAWAQQAQGNRHAGFILAALHGGCPKTIMSSMGGPDISAAAELRLPRHDDLSLTGFGAEGHRAAVPHRARPSPRRVLLILNAELLPT